MGSERFPCGHSGNRQMAGQRCCCTPNVPSRALGNCSQRVLDRSWEPLDERYYESRGLMQILFRFAAGFCPQLRNNELMARSARGPATVPYNSMGTQYRHLLRVRQQVAKIRQSHGMGFEFRYRNYRVALPG